MNTDQPLSVSLVSLGCPKNLVDSEKMLAQLAQGGCIVGAPMDQADVIVINTCGFLSAAREESLAVIHEALAHKAAGSARRVVVAGCLANREQAKLRDMLPGVDAILGVNDRDGILSAVVGKRRVFRYSEFAGQIASDAGRFRLTPRHTAYLRISEGCSQKCTFCTIPTIRGPFRSKAPQAVLDEARELISDGVVEINVIGQDTTSYGADLDDGSTLAGLMDKLAALDGAQWIRLMYAYPRRFSDKLIDTFASNERIVPYVDIPLQHIADRVLKRMGRKVTRQATEELLSKLRSRVPGMAIRTTLIVGFPGETDEDFEQLLGFVQAQRFSALGVFEYSPEEHTPASRLKEQVPDEVKASRAERIMLAQQEIAFEVNRRMAGQRIRVLVDGKAGRQNIGRYYAQAPDIDSICIIKGKAKPGMFIDAKVVGQQDYDLIVQSQ